MYPENCSDTIHKTMLILTLSVKHFEKRGIYELSVEYTRTRVSWQTRAHGLYRRGGVLAPYLSTPKARQPRPAVVVPHGGKNQLLWLHTEARASNGVTHGGNANRWPL